MDCKQFDEQVVRLDKIADLADEFVLVRLERITGMDLNVFEFDFDLTWAGLFLNADEKVYGRYGGRDAGSADDRLSLTGLRFAMQKALDAHRRQAKSKTTSPTAKPLFAETYPAARRLSKNECIHCHQINEFRRELLKTTGKWDRDVLWVYPLPENVGLTLEVDQANRVKAVSPNSAADKAGLRAGDLLDTLNGLPIASQADAMYALHKAPAKGPVSVSWQRGGKALSTSLDLADGWRKTNVTWRPSMLDILPGVSLYGLDLTAAEKKALGLPENRLAFRQDKNFGPEARAAGVQENDIVLGINGQPMEMTLLQFLAYMRQNHLVGERITLNVLRNGKKLDLPMTLR